MEVQPLFRRYPLAASAASFHNASGNRPRDVRILRNSSNRRCNGSSSFVTSATSCAMSYGLSVKLTLSGKRHLQSRTSAERTLEILHWLLRRDPRSRARMPAKPSGQSRSPEDVKTRPELSRYRLILISPRQAKTLEGRDHTEGLVTNVYPASRISKS